MRARQGLADCLVLAGREEDAITEYRELLRLNPGDNQGIRYMLLPLLIHNNLDEGGAELINTYPDDETASWLFSKALLEFRAAGDSPKSKDALLAALLINPYVPAYLTGKKSIPDELPQYLGYGDEEEAIHYAVDNYQNWWGTPGAIQWLKKHQEPVQPTKGRNAKAARDKHPPKKR